MKYFSTSYLNCPFSGITKGVNERSGSDKSVITENLGFLGAIRIRGNVTKSTYWISGGTSLGKALITKSYFVSSNLCSASAGSPVSNFISRFGAVRCSSLSKRGMKRYDAVTEQ